RPGRAVAARVADRSDAEVGERGRRAFRGRAVTARVALHGATGRMGRAIVAVLAESSELALVAAFGSPQDGELGRDAGELAGTRKLGVPIGVLGDSLEADVVIDFSTPDALSTLASRCAASRVALVSGTT